MIFSVHDDPLLSYLDEDGQSIEPEYYVPVIPTVLVRCSLPHTHAHTHTHASRPCSLTRTYVCVFLLQVNGSEGIGTGWSSSIPNYSPVDVISNLRRLISGEVRAPCGPPPLVPACACMPRGASLLQLSIPCVC